MTFVLLVWGRGRGVGGTEARMAEVVSEWKSRGERVVSFCLTREAATPLGNLLKASGSELVQTQKIHLLGQLIARQNPRLIVAFGLRASLVVRTLRLVSRARGRWWPLTLDARNGLEAGRGRTPWFVDRCTQWLVDRYVANSDAAAATLVAHGIAPRRVRVLYSALGEAWQGGVFTAPREQTSVVMVGNARPEKQHHLGLELFARLSDPAGLVVYTNDASRLKQQWAGLTATSAGHAEFREGQVVTPEVLRRTAVVLHPSSHESAPRCLMEARASGCHVVAFDVGDTVRIVGDGGEVVLSGDTDRLFAALQRAVRSAASGTLAHTRARYPSVASYTDSLDALGADR